MMFSFRRRRCPRINLTAAIVASCISLILSDLSLFVCCYDELQLSMVDPDSGFFMRPFFPLRNNLSVLEWPFVALPTARSVRATYGRLEPARADLPRGNIKNGDIDTETSIELKGQDVEGRWTVSAHIVADSANQERPIIQVLFSASALGLADANITSSRGGRSLSERKLCVSLIGTTTSAVGGDTLSSFCEIEGSEGVCVATVMVPIRWWGGETDKQPSSELATVVVSYSSFGVDRRSRCDGPGPRAGRARNDIPLPTVIGRVNLIPPRQDLPQYLELKEDQHILIYIPRASVHQGSRFNVPIKLEPASDLKVFVIKVRARHGIHVVGAEIRRRLGGGLLGSNGTRWRIAVDINARRLGGTVTAYLADKDTPRNSAVLSDIDDITSTQGQAEDVFEWIFEVDEDIAHDGSGKEGDERGGNVGRLSFSLEYELGGRATEKLQSAEVAGPSGGASVENKAVARIQIQQDSVAAIVPVVKSTDVVNTAVLTGRVQSIPMRVYSVRYHGTVTDVTSQTTCHSADEQVLQVALSCNMVYLDGTETRGASSVFVFAKYRRHTRQIALRVWIPEMPLSIELSDSKLSQIAGWRLAPGVSSSAAPAGSTSRGKSSADIDVDLDDVSKLKDATFSSGFSSFSSSSYCPLRYQSAIIEVYARLTTSSDLQATSSGGAIDINAPSSGVGTTSYMLHRKAQFRMTDFVRPQLRVSDASIAQLRGNIVDGIKQGRTEIQVVSRTGRVIGTKEIKVTGDRVNIDKLDVQLVTGLAIYVDFKADFPGALTARVVKMSRITRKHQEASININVKFDDDSRIPLHVLLSSDYRLNVDVLDKNIVSYNPATVSAVGMATGHGDFIRIELYSGGSVSCTSGGAVSKTPRPLAIGYANVNVNISSDEPTQNDAGHYGYPRGSVDDPRGGAGGDSDWGNSKSARGRSGKGGSGGRNLGVILDDSSLKPHKEAQMQPISDSSPLRGGGAPGAMTSLEVAMYVLLAIFSVAVVVFAANCMLFLVARRRRVNKAKSLDQDDVGGMRNGKNPVAEAADWVWIGHDTLERNAVNTGCPLTLMPEADFNGNHGGVLGAGGFVDGQPMLLTSGGFGSIERETGLKAGSEGGGSNRSSQISTYLGSECSIRITANLIPDDNGNTLSEDDILSASPPRRTSPTPVKETTAERRSNGDGSAKPSPCSSSERSPKIIPVLPPVKVVSSPPPATKKTAPQTKILPASAASSLARSTMSREERLRQLEEAVASGSDIDWDYDELGMTYEELMDYFDNLKESTA